VLLATLVLSGVLALLPALVRRYDRVERAQAELAASSMRVLPRRRRRTVPGPAPVRPPTLALRRLAGPVVGRASVPGALVPGDPADDALVRAALARVARLEARRRGRQALAEAAAAAAATSREERQRVARARRAAALRRWRRYRRRRVLVTLVVLLLLQVAGLALAGPGFLSGLTLSAGGVLLYLVHLRGAAASERRSAATARRRRHRARILAREAALAAGVAEEVEAMVAAWLATPRPERVEPPEEVVVTLAAGGREVVRGEDGTWYPRPVPVPLYVTAPRAPQVVATGGENAGRVAAAGPGGPRERLAIEAPARRAVNE